MATVMTNIKIVNAGPKPADRLHVGDAIAGGPFVSTLLEANFLPEQREMVELLFSQHHSGDYPPSGSYRITVPRKQMFYVVQFEQA
jgi:hypothetical protein